MLWQVEQYPIEANIAPRATTSGLKLEEAGVATSGSAGRHANAAKPTSPITPAAAASNAQRRTVPPFTRAIHREDNEAEFDKFYPLSSTNILSERPEGPQLRVASSLLHRKGYRAPYTTQMSNTRQFRTACPSRCSRRLRRWQLGYSSRCTSN